MLLALLFAAAFCFAVQRDTFVRRWMLPEPAGVAASEADLSRPVPAIRVDKASLPDAVAELARVTGMPLSIDPPLAREYADEPITLNLKDVTIAEALEQLRPQGHEVSRLVLVRRGDAFVLRSDADLRTTAVMRVYDINALLPTTPDPTWNDPQIQTGNLCFPNPQRPTSAEQALLEDRQSQAESIATMVYYDLADRQPPAYGIHGSFPAPPYEVHAVGVRNRLIVIAPEIDQAYVKSLLQTLTNGKPSGGHGSAASDGGRP